MANELLKFRRGTYAQINAAERANGTIYVATDEKALYVDTATERIRIGDFIRVDSVEEITPPYSTSSLYYVEADNALLKYDGSAWKQVNGTDDIKSSLAALTDRVATNESNISGLQGKMTTAEGKITALENTVGKAAEGENAATGLVKDVADLKAAIGMGEDGEADGIGATVSQLVTDLDTLEAEVHGTDGNGGMKATLADHTSRIGTAETDIDNLEKALADHETKAGQTYATKTELANVKSALQAEIDADVAAEASRADTEEKRLAGLIAENKAIAEAALTKKAFNTFKNDNTTAINNAKTDAVSEANEYTDGKITAEEQRADGKYATKTALEAINNTVSGHTSAIELISNTLNDKADKATVESTYVKKADADAKLAKIDTTKTVSEAIVDAVGAEESRAKGEEQRIEGIASEAKSKANDAYDLASEKTTTTEVQAQIEAYGYATTTQVDTAKNEAIAAAKTAGDGAYAAKSIETTVATHTSELNTLMGEASTAGSVAEAKKAGDDALALIGDANSGLTQTVNAHENYITNILKGADTVAGSVAEAKKAGTDAMTKATSNAGDISDLKSKVSTLETNSATKTELSNVQTALEQKIANDINAANAMDYKGGVASEDNLDEKTNVKSGDTYVATGAFEFTDGRIVLPGDLIIASGTEVNGVIADPTWEIVHTGYDASLEQELKTVDGKIQLTSAVSDANNGQISFVAEAGSSAKVSVANNTVTIGMMWDDFPTA